MISVVLTHSLDRLKEPTDLQALRTVQRSTPDILARVFQADVDLHLRFNYTGELTDHKRQQLDHIVESYPTSNSTEVVSQSDIVEELRGYISIAPSMADNLKFIRHFMQHYAFFRTAYELNQSGRGGDHYLRMRPDVTFGRHFNPHQLFDRRCEYTGGDGAMYSSGLYKLPSRIRPYAVRDVVYGVDRRFLELSQPYFQRWLRAGYQRVWECHRGIIPPAEQILVNPESWLAELPSLSGASIITPKEWLVDLTRNLHE